ncbi:hypothetical protein [Francisella sp. SYW-2]|uniref:hypothetical protein n=1 Tax=Francisella sp. SYW-2 TaxID=2610886 RepID=UPI00168D877B|nr:hypothetical protein [Francisella sp. SYW-2]
MRVVELTEYCVFASYRYVVDDFSVVISPNKKIKMLYNVHEDLISMFSKVRSSWNS